MRSDAIWGLGCEQRRFCCLGCSWSGRAGGGVPEFGQEGFYAGDGNVKFPSSSPPPAIPDCRSVRIGPEWGKLNAKWDLGNVASFAETDVWELGGKSCLGGGPAEFLIPPPAPQFRHARHVWIFFFFWTDSRSVCVLGSVGDGSCFGVRRSGLSECPFHPRPITTFQTPPSGILWLLEWVL